MVKKKCRKYTAGDKYCNLFMEEKLGIASYNHESLNEKSQILNLYWHKKKFGYLVDKI